MTGAVTQDEANSFFDNLYENHDINHDHCVPAYTRLADRSGIDIQEARLLFLNWADKKFNDVED